MVRLPSVSVRWCNVQAERARKNAEAGLNEATSRINELTVNITSITGDRRRFEADLASLQSELEEAHRGRREAEDRADRLQMELNRLAEELRREQENYKNAESIRKSLEVEIREINVKLEEAESFAQREGKRLIAKLQARVRRISFSFHVIIINNGNVFCLRSLIRISVIVWRLILAAGVLCPGACDLVAQRLGRRTCDQAVVGSIPGWAAIMLPKSTQPSIPPG